MPIRVSCRCGQSLSVPDTMAGKAGKCPKCSEIIRIPSGSASGAPTPPSSAKGPSATAKKAPRTAAKSASAAQVEPVSASGALDQLFSDAGLDKKKSPECPACKAPIDAGAALCVRCGFHLATGQKLKGVEIEIPGDPGQFANRQLNEAKRSLKKETDADEAAKYTGAPWWVSLAVVLGLVTVIAFGVILVDGQVGSEEEGVSLRAPQTTIQGKIQRLPIANALLVVGALVSSMVVVMAWIATTATAFYDKATQGILCLAIPVYAHYYSFKHRKTMGNTMKILWGWSLVWIALAIGMVVTPTWKFLIS